MAFRDSRNGRHEGRTTDKRTRTSRRAFLVGGRAGRRRLVGRRRLSGHHAPPASSARSAGKRITVGAIGVGRITPGRTCPRPANTIMPRSSRSVTWTRIVSRPAKTISSTTPTPRKPATRTRLPRLCNYREVLANHNIDAVIISTPDHWHSIIAVDAVRAGKDVYLQKPASLTIAEAAPERRRRPVRRILQIGSQHRSWPNNQFRAAASWCAMAASASSDSRGWPAWRSHGRRTSRCPCQPNLNYDMWLGSTPAASLHRNRVHPQTGFPSPSTGWLRNESSAPE